MEAPSDICPWADLFVHFLEGLGLGVIIGAFAGMALPVKSAFARSIGVDTYER